MADDRKMIITPEQWRKISIWAFGKSNAEFDKTKSFQYIYIENLRIYYHEEDKELSVEARRINLATDIVELQLQVDELMEVLK